MYYLILRENLLLTECELNLNVFFKFLKFKEKICYRFYSLLLLRLDFKKIKKEWG